MAGLINSVADLINPIIPKLKNLWKNSKYIRIISVCTSSLFGTLLIRNTLIKLLWKIQGLPPAYKVGFPGIGIAAQLLNPQMWKTFKLPYATVNILYIVYTILYNVYMLLCVYNVIEYRLNLQQRHVSL